MSSSSLKKQDCDADRDNGGVFQNILDWANTMCEGGGSCGDREYGATTTNGRTSPPATTQQDQQGTQPSSPTAPTESKDPVDLGPIRDVFDFVFGGNKNGDGNDDKGSSPETTTTIAVDQREAITEDQDVEEKSGGPSASDDFLSEEFKEILSLVENGNILEALTDLVVHVVNGCLDVNLLIVALAIGEGASETEGSKPKTSLAILIIMMLLGWYWLLGNFVLPIYKFFDRKRYFLWLGDKNWRCCCGDPCVAAVCDKRREDAFSLFHPRNGIIANFFISDICFTLVAYFNSDSDGDPFFIVKALFAVLEAMFSFEAICKEFAYAKKLYEYHESGRISI